MRYINCLLNLEELYKIEKIKKNAKNNLVFLCLGNKKVNFDCFASFVADYLRKFNVKAYVYGGIKYPLYGEELVTMNKFLLKQHVNDTIIFIDVAKTNKISENGKILISSKKFQVANSSVKFVYNFSICYLLNFKSDKQYKRQKEAAIKIATFLAN